MFVLSLDGIDAFLFSLLFAVKQTVWICPHVPFNRNLLCMSLLTLYSVDNTALPEYIMNLSDLTWVTSFHAQSYILFLNAQSLNKTYKKHSFNIHTHAQKTCTFA